MYIHSISLKNIKSFENLEFVFQRADKSYAGWTVITGANGSGKTTVLRAIGFLLAGKKIYHFLVYDASTWIRIGEDNAVIELKVVTDKNWNSYKGTKNETTNFLSNKLVIAAFDDGLDYIIDSYPIQTEGKSNLNSYLNNFFCCGYGPFRRVKGALSEAQTVMSAPIIERFVTLFREDAYLSETDVWLKSLRFKTLEGDVSSKDILDKTLAFLGDELLPNGYTIQEVDSNGLWIKNNEGQVLLWQDLSDGYRTVLALMVDIIRLGHKTYQPKSIFEVKNDKIICVMPGVVLIDEIDAHMHPEWQREIGFWLKEHFPNIQFIVTTHSPLICQAADPDGIFHLPAPPDEPFKLSAEAQKRIIASTANEIMLSDAFRMENTRSSQAVEARSRYSALKAKLQAGAELTEEEKNEFDKIKSFIF